MSSVQPEGVHAIMTVDPGRTTGVFAGWVDLKSTRVETLKSGLLKAKSREVTGSITTQGRELLHIWILFNYAANEANIPIPNRHCAVEDFVLRRRGAGGATGDLTSCWVGGAFAMAMELSQIIVPIKWQQPSQAKRLATDARLRDWGLWRVGSPHERDAARHFALAVDGLIT